MRESTKDLIDAMNEPAAFDRRKAKRLFLNFAVEISGVDRNGRSFVERTKTEDISESGCRLLTGIPLERGDVIDIRLVTPEGQRMPEESAQPFKIMWVHATKAGWSIGARKIPDGKIWKVSFPPNKSIS